MIAMKRQRLLVLLQSAEPCSQPEPALARAVFLARETNATLELFLSDDSTAPPSIGQAGLKVCPRAPICEGLKRHLKWSRIVWLMGSG